MHMRACHENKWQRGIVHRILGPHIELALPSGGLFKAPNRGFELGEEVAFTIDMTSGKIRLILPADVAEIRNMINIEPDEITGVAQTEDEGNDDDEFQEVPDGEYEYLGNRQKHEVLAHQGSEEDREFVRLWEDHGDDDSEDPDEPGRWVGSESRFHLDQE